MSPTEEQAAQVRAHLDIPYRPVNPAEFGQLFGHHLDRYENSSEPTCSELRKFGGRYKI